MITNVPWYVPNAILHTYLQIAAITEEIQGISKIYKDRLSAQPNVLVSNLLNTGRRRKRFKYANIPDGWIQLTIYYICEF